MAGWICRLWIETENGWTCEADLYDTEEDAYIIGEVHNNTITADEIDRTYEVFAA